MTWQSSLALIAAEIGGMVMGWLSCRLRARVKMERDRRACLKLADYAAEKIRSVEENANCMAMINAIRSGGGSVTLLSDNADFNGEPNCAIEVCADFTAWGVQHFAGETLRECLSQAIERMMDQREADAIMWDMKPTGR